MVKTIVLHYGFALKNRESETNKKVLSKLKGHGPVRMWPETFQPCITLLDNTAKSLGLESTRARENSDSPLEYDHVFSAEIAPSKEAFIEPNFAKLLFQDIIEMASSLNIEA